MTFYFHIFLKFLHYFAICPFPDIIIQTNKLFTFRDLLNVPAKCIVLKNAEDWQPLTIDHPIFEVLKQDTADNNNV